METFPDGTVWVKEYVNQSGVNTVFTSHEMDVETKFFYAKARYYDAQLGRFISVDPIIGSYLDGKPNGGVYSANNLNMYQYCYNNPLAFVDPTGERPLTSSEKAFVLNVIGGYGFYIYNGIPVTTGDFGKRLNNVDINDDVSGRAYSLLALPQKTGH